MSKGTDGANAPACGAPTPGPWRVYDDSKDGKTNRIEIAAFGKTVARIYCSAPEEDLPNARLIAAAPELLDACREFIAQLGPGGYYPTAGKPLTDKMRAAIAKATGEGVSVPNEGGV